MIESYYVWSLDECTSGLPGTLYVLESQTMNCRRGCCGSGWETAICAHVTLQPQAAKLRSCSPSEGGVAAQRLLTEVAADYCMFVQILH